MMMKSLGQRLKQRMLGPKYYTGSERKYGTLDIEMMELTDSKAGTVTSAL